MRGNYFLKIIVTVCAACLPYACIYAQSVTFKFTGAEQTYIVPEGVTKVVVDAKGAAGGNSSFSRGGYGGRVQCTLAVTPGTVLNLYVGGAGQNKTGLNAAGGYNGGGIGQGNAGGGGGASDIRIGGNALSNRVIVAAGGGGGATNSLNRDYDRGGNGGGLTGENGYSYSGNSSVMGGFGGREIDWSKLPNYTIFKNGALGIGGNGYDDDGNCGGGGGGYYGGCGGGAYTGSGGGGGSSYSDPVQAKAAVHIQGYNKAGDGEISITPLISTAPPVEKKTPEVVADNGDLFEPKSFTYTGGTQTYVVPDGVNRLGIDLQGAAGGSTGFSRGGYGGRVRCDLAVTPGAILNINIGGAGQSSMGLSSKGGYNGGGNGEEYAGGGGGASDIRFGGLALSNRVVVAGGGGGGSANSANINYDRGGDGGGLTGETGYSYSSNTNGRGGSGGGAAAASADPALKFSSFNGKQEISRAVINEYSGGGGGGGYYAGGSGSCGGGGGSSYTDPLLAGSVVHARGYNKDGNGLLILQPFLPDQKGWDAYDDKSFTPTGSLWGEVFSDFAYKAHADTILEGRSGISQYAKVPAGVNMFQFRRIAIGYKYDMSAKFSAEFLMAAEDDYSTPMYAAQGDLLANNKFAPFIKLANLRWKNIFKGSDLVMGQLYTPAFHSTSEEMWGYRSISRTLTHIYRTNEYDMGVSLQGHLPNNKNLGYNVMVGNGTGAVPEIDAFKWFYGDVYYKFGNNKFMVDFYADYQKLTWTQTWHRDRQMNKVFVAYSVPKITVGVEMFYTRLMGDDIATLRDGVTTDTITTYRNAVSVFVRGRIYKNKLGFFARYDDYSWNANNNNKIFQSYDDQTTIYDHNTKQEFVTFGLDYSPYKNVHLMPNLWYNYYENVSPSSIGNGNKDYDLVYRVTLSYNFGKRQ